MTTAPLLPTTDRDRRQQQVENYTLMMRVVDIIEQTMEQEAMDDVTLAERAKIPLRSLQATLVGRRPIMANELLSIAEVFGLRASDLLVTAESMHS